MKSPTPKQIIAARTKAGLSQTAAAAMVHITLRSWQRYETEGRDMHPALWELFQIKTQSQQEAKS